MIDLSIEQVTLIVLLVITAVCFFWALYENDKRKQAEEDNSDYWRKSLSKAKETQELQNNLEALTQQLKQLEFVNNEYKTEIEGLKEGIENLRLRRKYWEEHYHNKNNDVKQFSLINADLLTELRKKKRLIQVLNGRIGGLTKQNNRLRNNG